MNKRLVAGAVLAGAAVFALPMFAHAWGAGERCLDGPRGAMMHGYGHHHGMRGERALHGEPMGMRAYAAELQLTEEQRGKLAELRKSNAQAMQEQARTLREARRELRALGFSADYDETRVRALAERMAGASAEMAIRRARAANDFYQVLTPEQRQKFSERFSRMEERRTYRRDGRRGAADRSETGRPEAGPRV